MSDTTSSQPLYEAAETYQLACPTYHTSAGTCSCCSTRRSRCVCRCCYDRLLEPEADHALGSTDAPPQEVQRLGVAHAEEPESPMAIHIACTKPSTEIYFATSLDSGKTWEKASKEGSSRIDCEFITRRGVRYLFHVGLAGGIYYRAWENARDGKEHKCGWYGVEGTPTTQHPLSLAMSGEGGVDIFCVNNQRQTLHRVWTGRGRAGDQWSPEWAVIGDEPLSDSQPVAISRGVSLLDLFIVSGAKLYWKSWVDLQWQPSLKGFQKIGKHCARAATPTAVARHRERIDVFVLGPDGQLLHKTWDGSGWKPAGSDLIDLGGSFASAPAVVRRTDERLDIFAIGKDEKLYHRALSGSSWTPAKGYNCLGGNFCSRLSPTVTNSRDGLDIFLVGGEQTYNAVYHKRWDGHGIPPSSGFRRLGHWKSSTRVAAVVRDQELTSETDGKWFQA